MDGFNAEYLPPERGHDPPASAECPCAKEGCTSQTGPHRDIEGRGETCGEEYQCNDPELFLGVVCPVGERHYCRGHPVEPDDIPVYHTLCISQQDPGCLPHE